MHGTTSMPVARRARASAVLARAALEQIIDVRLARLEAELGGAGSVAASGRVKLVCLRALGGPGAARAAWAWSALSSACHHHSYELAPSVGEIEGLVAEVTALAAESR